MIETAKIEPTLKRSVGLPLLTLYGLGTILGAGIYVLIGEVAGAAGLAAPSAFMIASVVAGLTAFSYAELAARLPKSAGEAAYVDAAFHRPALSQLIGWAIVAMGVVSSATMSRGLVGYLNVFIDSPAAVIIAITVVALTALAAWGITQSLLAAALVTVLEILGLVYVCVVAGDSLVDSQVPWHTILPEWEIAAITGVLSGAFIAFYAFIGFEDIVNIAEEVKSPSKLVPAAIILSLAISSIAYLLVAIVAVRALPPADLAASEAPLAAIVASRGIAPEYMAAISVLAVINGGLVQLIMASRVLYGMASQQLAWQPFARVDARTRTPVVATLFVGAITLFLALFFSLGGLARFTSALALLIFMTINGALWRLKRAAPASEFSVPLAVPIAGLFCCALMLAQWGFELVQRLPGTS